MLVAFGALILAHWANNEPTLSVKVVIEMVVAILFIAFLEGIPETQPIAQGLAWIFLAATLLSSKSILTGLSKVTGTGTGAPSAS
jgi:hypothetical protein